MEFRCILRPHMAVRPPPLQALDRVPQTQARQQQESDAED
jgi:hypothetical protein